MVFNQNRAVLLVGTFSRTARIQGHTAQEEDKVFAYVPVDFQEGVCAGQHGGGVALVGDGHVGHTPHKVRTHAAPSFGSKRDFGAEAYVIYPGEQRLRVGRELLYRETPGRYISIENTSCSFLI